LIYEIETLFKISVDSSEDGIYLLNMFQLGSLLVSIVKDGKKHGMGSALTLKPAH